jgi:hypothetical protein
MTDETKLETKLELEQLFADVLSEAAVLHAHREKFSPERIEAFVRDVKLCLTDYLTFISEPEAIVRSAHSATWFRQRFPEWERQGHARWSPKNKKQRTYRVMIVPLASDENDIRAAARRAAQDAARESA